MSSPDPRAHDRSDADYRDPLKKMVAKKMRKADRKTWQKATRKVGKITDGGGRKYSKEEIYKSLKGETRVGRELAEYRKHEGYDD